MSAATGDYVFGLTLVGFHLGCVLAPRLFARAATTHVGTVPAGAVVDHPVIASAGLVLLGGRTRLVGPLAPRVIRCTLGGVVTGSARGLMRS